MNIEAGIYEPRASLLSRVRLIEAVAKIKL